MTNHAFFLTETSLLGPDDHVMNDPSEVSSLFSSQMLAAEATPGRSALVEPSAILDSLRETGRNER